MFILLVPYFYFIGKHLKEENKRREWFCDFAAQKGFDPLEPENWYNITLDDVAENTKVSFVQTTKKKKKREREREMRRYEKLEGGLRFRSAKRFRSSRTRKLV